MLYASVLHFIKKYVFYTLDCFPTKWSFCHSFIFQCTYVVSANNVISQRRRVIKASIGLLIVAGVSWLLGYFISSIPASWSPICYTTKNDDPIVCPNMSLPSVPFVAPQIDVVSMWTMSHRLATLSIRLVVSSLFRIGEGEEKYSGNIVVLHLY